MPTAKKTRSAKPAPVRLIGITAEALALKPDMTCEDTVILRSVNVEGTRATLTFASMEHGLVRAHLKAINRPIQMEIQKVLEDLKIDISNPTEIRATLKVSMHLNWYISLQDWDTPKTKTTEVVDSICDF